MNYSKMRQVATKLLKSFGNSKNSILIHKEENGETKEYKGLAVKLKYNSEAIGLTGNVIQAGDAKILCLFDVMPVESVDIIRIGDETFSIINSGDTSPNNVTKLLYTLQVRKN